MTQGNLWIEEEFNYFGAKLCRSHLNASYMNIIVISCSFLTLHLAQSPSLCEKELWWSSVLTSFLNSLRVSKQRDSLIPYLVYLYAMPIPRTIFFFQMMIISYSFRSMHRNLTRLRLWYFESEVFLCNRTAWQGIIWIPFTTTLHRTYSKRTVWGT